LKLDMLAILTTHPIQYQVPIWKELARRGQVPFEVWYLSDQGARHGLDAEFGREFSWDVDLLGGYPHRFLSTQPPRADLKTFRGARIGSLEHLFRDKKALWINGWQVQAYWQAAFQASRLGVPVWLRGESNDLAPRPRARTVARWIALRLLFHHISRFLYIGHANWREYVRFGVRPEQLVPAPYCVDNSRFRASAEAARGERETLRAQWNIPATAICLLYAGKLIAKKRLFDLFDAFSIALERHPALAGSMHLLLAGDGELMPPLQSKAAHLAARYGKPVASFAGFLNQTQMPQAYAVADCLVLPSDSRETWGLVVNEALASGIPAIVSDLCGCAEDLIGPLDPQFVFPCGRVDILADVIEAVSTGRLPLPCAGRCRGVVSRHDLSLTVDTVTQEYARLASV